MMIILGCWFVWQIFDDHDADDGDNDDDDDDDDNDDDPWMLVGSANICAIKSDLNLFKGHQWWWATTPPKSSKIDRAFNSHSILNF